MKKSKNNRTIILSVVLVGLLILAYKTMFGGTSADLLVDENIIAGDRIAATLAEIERINFDTTIMQNQNFKSLKSIEIPLLNLPVGRKNPFQAF